LKLRKPQHERLDHPIISYLIGFIFIVLALVVFVGVVHHLTISHHGPELLKPLIDKYFTEPESAILVEAKRQEDLEIHRHFHRIAAFPKLAENERSVCYICHSDYPHSKNTQIRSLLNMHTQYFVCETCHIKERKDRDILYQWYHPTHDNPAGPFFGTHYDPLTGNLAQVEDLTSKMAPYYKRGLEIESALQNQDAPLAKDFVKVRDQLTPEQRDGVKNQFHENIKPKGHECKDCHAQDGLLDLKKLGFADDRMADLQQLSIKGAITRNEEVYLPNLLKQ
jgi:DNA-directed RNA polymerase subunit M/transcription elongation factor TFIIS